MSNPIWKTFTEATPQDGENIWLWDWGLGMESPTRFQYSPGLESIWGNTAHWTPAPTDQDRPTVPPKWYK